jgi:hypothetical protein
VPILFEERIAKEQIRQHRDRLYVFGDNLVQKGYGSLVRVCRDEPNAVGVPTNRAPSMAPGAFFTNSDRSCGRELGL